MLNQKLEQLAAWTLRVT